MMAFTAALRRQPLVQAMRPHQWLKNAFVLAPVVFAKHGLEAPYLLRSVMAFMGFCLISSAVYIVNDIVDRHADAQHPTKRHRPVAAGTLTLINARRASILLLLMGLGTICTLGMHCLIAALLYLCVNTLYSLRLKHIAYLDILCIASGFVIRVWLGSLAVHVQLSGYLVLNSLLLACFLALGKRIHEIAQIKAYALTRKSLQGYTSSAPRKVFYLLGFSTLSAYTAYVFDPNTAQFFRTKYLWTTLPMVFLGLVRFTILSLKSSAPESPTDAMTRDPLFVLNILAWGICVFVLIYVGP